MNETKQGCKAKYLAPLFCLQRIRWPFELQDTVKDDGVTAYLYGRLDLPSLSDGLVYSLSTAFEADGVYYVCAAIKDQDRSVAGHAIIQLDQDLSVTDAYFVHLPERYYIFQRLVQEDSVYLFATYQPNTIFYQFNDDESPVFLSISMI